VAKRHLYIALFAVAIIVLLIVQYQYLRIGLSLARNQFKDKLIEAEKVIKEDLQSENKLTFLMGESLGKNIYFNLAKDSLLDASNTFLRDQLKSRIEEKGLPSNFSFILKDDNNKVLLYSRDTLNNNDHLITYRIKLEGYLSSLLDKNLVLDLRFKDLNSYFLSQLNGLTLPTILCIIAICMVVIWFSVEYYGQRQLITTTNDFINNLTHELKTPVFSIALATKLLEEKPKAEQSPLISAIRQQLERLNRHIDQVLSLGSLENKRNILNLQNVDLNTHLNNWCEHFQNRSKNEDYVFDYFIENKPFRIKAEISHLENAINNILDNAIKYSKEPAIRLDARAENKWLKISISDNGEGISEKERKKIFEKFYRIPNGDVHKVKGYGLGLSYVYQIIKKHRGKIEVKSNQPMGTIVCILLPLQHG